MKKISLVLFLTTFSLFGQNSAKTCELLSKINALIQHEHFHPKPVDDSLSVFVFDTFMDGLDGNRNLFTKTEYENLCKSRLLLDNYILQNDCSFMNDFISVYQFALERKKKTLEKMQNEVLDYTAKDTVKFSKKNFPFDLEAANIDKVWRKRIKYDILEDISKLSSNLDSLNQNFAKLEKISKVKIFDTHLCKVNSILESKKGLGYDLQNDFLNIFCTYFDPHTNYFSQDAKTSFMSDLTTSGLSLGLNVSLNDKEEIVVEEIVPGGPAARAEKFEKDDVILKVSNKKGEDYLVSCTSLDKIGELIYSDSNEEIELTIQKKNGNILAVLLKKQVMRTTANAVSSFIVEKEIKVGYINIPNFYSDFDGYSEQGCADDVAKEIVKLNQDNIQGLIIDLQDNGGGSMEEAIKLAGMFIDYGPVSVLVNSKNKQSVLKDYNRGSVYYGPIVILINGNSASASEFFTATMQDYNRAIIVGSKSLGKASMQTILPLDENKQDFVKLTVEKFYRITGDSNQIKGIIPDIALPILYDSIVPREISYKTALKYDVINSKTRFAPFRKDYYPSIIDLSNSRLKNNALFNEINLTNDGINALYNDPKKSLQVTFKEVFNDIHEIDSLWKKVKKIAKIENNCAISNNSYDSEKLKLDSFQQEINTYKIKDLKTSPYIEEAVAILNDINNYGK
ncbi:carboxy terminal-processing peptidase [Flavobacterium soyangense]|uniref:Carboxy terminal-processing peptidase n=1 Tax=Flavobacterium soyangense TaxID=2023265 RepID=A0A930U850_9FLAO|nr:carboxy terminal-processing peptidase [Flavobacterium soyangense]MBF2708501.1 carboxy terminal-processing peptidase [Flavobacterium soyangense]